MSRALSTFVISLTPFAEDGSFDAEAFRGHLRRLRDSGIGVYVGGGGSGEGYALSAAEMHQVLEIAHEELTGRVPVRAMGVEPRTAKAMIDYAAVVADVGIEAMQIYSLDMGHAGKPRPLELQRYFEDILSAISVPCAISTHTSVGYVLPIPLLVQLSERFDHVIGVNCSVPDITYVVELVDALDERLEIHVGGPMQAVDAMSLGASGYLSSDANLAPRLCMSVVESFGAGDLRRCATDFGRLLRLFTGLQRLGGGVRATKVALGLLGLPGGFPRAPRMRVDDPDTIASLIDLMDSLDIRGSERLPAADRSR